MRCVEVESKILNEVVITKFFAQKKPHKTPPLPRPRPPPPPPKRLPCH